jgi:hypothetical protein
MKYIISESQLRLLSEKNFVNQEEVDAILDKISNSGYDSLNDMEKHILKNPDAEVERGEHVDSNCIDTLVEMLFEYGLIERDKINIYDEFVEIYDFSDVAGIDWFNEENFVRMYCMVDGDMKVVVEFEDNGEEERDQVYDHLKDVWEPQLDDVEFIMDDEESSEEF